MDLLLPQSQEVHMASSQLVTEHLEGFQVSWQWFKILVLKATTKLVIMKKSNHQGFRVNVF